MKPVKIHHQFDIFINASLLIVAADDCSTDCDDADPLSDTANGKVSHKTNPRYTKIHEKKIPGLAKVISANLYH